MTFLMLSQGVGNYSLHMRPLDGDLDKVLNVDLTPRPGLRPPDSIAARRYGREVETTYLPTRMYPNLRTKTFPDFYQVEMGYACSAKFRDMVESLEPGVHQFVPVDVTTKKGVFIETMYWFMPCQRLDTVVVNLVYPPVDKFGRVRTTNKSVEGFRLPFDPTRRKVNHFWVEERISNEFFVSREFVTELERLGLIGAEFIEFENV